MIPTWAPDAAAACLGALVDASGDSSQPSDEARPAPRDDRSVERWIQATAAWLGREATHVDVPYRDFPRFLRTAGPAMIRLPGGEYVALTADGRLLAPDLRVVAVPAHELRSAIFQSQEAAAAADAERLLHTTDRPARRQSARDVLMRARLSHVRAVACCWRLEAPPGGAFWRLLRMAGLWPRLGGLALAHTAEYALWIGAWWMIGLGALRGHLDRGWVMGWVLVLVTIVPMRAAVTWLQGRLAIAAGGLLKERLLYGALRLDRDVVRRQGMGQFVGQVVETEALESLALSGGVTALVATIELIAAGAIGAFATGWRFPAMLVMWIAVTAAIGLRYYRRSGEWTGVRLGLTGDLIERMVGHQTRLAQEPRARWHESEDLQLRAYQAASRRMDAAAPWLTAVVPRGWLVVGVLGLWPAFVARGTSTERLATELGAVLLAYYAFSKASSGAASLAHAAIAWQQARPLLDASATEEPRTPPSLARAPAPPQPGEVIVEGRNVAYSYAGRPQPVLRACGFRIRAGDRILLAGDSGAGKSTLASLIAGVQPPSAGVVLAGGLDRRSLGPQGWRQRVAVVPQSHENHILNGPLAFNLLLGRVGPLGDADIRDAEAICEELGLGVLLGRMPSGIMQMVGESGWQLSHGERSRVFVARALLQESPFVLLDESLAALDPESLRRTIACIERRTSAALVIAHS